MASNAFTPPHFTRPFRRRSGAENARVWRLFVSSFACLSDKQDAANGLTGENDKKEAWTHGTSINGRDHYV